MKRLTDIVWPLARGRFNYLRGQEESAGTRLLVLEATLLLQAGWRDLVDTLWLVRSPAAAVRERLAGRGVMEAEARIAGSQPPPEAASQADLVIENDSDLVSLTAQVDEAWLTLQSRRLV
jgi:dephospho-CoA kinase